jgi:hypothetical protein
VQPGYALRRVLIERPRQLYLTGIAKRRTLCNSPARILVLPLEASKLSCRFHSKRLVIISFQYFNIEKCPSSGRKK